MEYEEPVYPYKIFDCTKDKDNSLRVLAEGAVPRRTLPAGTAPRRTHPDEEQDSLTRQNADNDFLTRYIFGMSQLCTYKIKTYYGRTKGRKDVPIY